MGRVTCFVQECPICGRRLQVRVEYLGRAMQCRHCGGQFLANDDSNDADESRSEGNGNSSASYFAVLSHCWKNA